MTNYKLNAMEEVILSDSEDFSTILTRVIKEVNSGAEKVRELTLAERKYLNQFIKTQKNCKFHKKSSYFLRDSIKEVEKKLQIKLEKNYLLAGKSDEYVDEYEGYLENTSPQWLKDICEVDFSKNYPEGFLDSDGTLWVTSIPIQLFGPLERYWIMIVGTSESLDDPPKFLENGDISIGKKENCFDWWKTYLSETYFDDDDKKMFENLGILICSKFFATQLVIDFGKKVFYIPNTPDEEISKLFSNFAI